MMNVNFKQGRFSNYLTAFTLVCLITLTATNTQVQTNVKETLAMTSNFYKATKSKKTTASEASNTAYVVTSRFDKRKVKTQLRIAFSEYHGYADQIAALHKTALALMQQYPKKEARIRNLTKIVAAENNYALRFHEDGESIIYRELTAKEVERELEKLEAVEEVFVEEIPEPTEILQKPTVKQPIQALQLKAYPNPTTEKLTVSFKGEAIPTTITIVDISGKEIHKSELQRFNGSYKETISLDKHVKGMVTVHITQDGQTLQKKIFVVQ